MRKEIDSKLKEIADATAANWIKNKSQIAPCLYTGTIGLLIFLTYYKQYSGDDKYQHIIDEMLDNCCETICNGIYYTPFSGGLAGVLYGLNHLSEHGLIDIDLEELHNGYSQFLTLNLRTYSASRAFDFMHEATGIAIYLLKYGNSADLSAVADYIRSLDHNADHSNNTVKWTSDVNADKKMKYNIALSHGMSSIAIFLARCIEKGIEQERCNRLLTGVINFILLQQLDHNQYGSCFPYTSLESDKPIKSRMAWCYGDLGVAIALWKAGVALNSNQYKTKAYEVIGFATDRRNLESEMVYDAGICHGTAGISQIFRRMYYNTQNDSFLSTSNFWIEETLKMAKWNGEESAGFKAAGKDLNDWESDYYLLKGIAGIGLVLIASQGDHKLSNWDEVLLLS